MKKLLAKKHTAIALGLVCLLMWCTPARAITVKEEDKLGRESMKYIVRQFQLVSDPTIDDYVNKIGQKLLKYMPPQPFTYHFYVINKDVYNAFAIPGGHIFIYSGLIEAMDSEDELAGILGHEISHVVCRHISKNIERSKKFNLATMAGMVAGIFLGAATGDAAAMQALTIGSVAAGQTAALAYSRDDESQADQLGVKCIVDAGYSPEGLLDILKKIRGKQWFGSDQIPTYMMTHPAIEDRIVWIDGWAAAHPKSLVKHQAGANRAFDRTKIRLEALYGDPNVALDKFEKMLAKNPDDDDVVYGYALALAQIGKRSEAIKQLKRVQAKNALDPLILTDMGRIYFLDGRYEEAVNTLEGAVSIGADNSEGLFYLGRSRMEMNQLEKARNVFNKLIDKDTEYQQAYYFLGETEGRLNDLPDAHYNLGQFYYMKGDYRTARYHLEKAQAMLHDHEKLDHIRKIMEAMGKPERGNRQGLRLNPSQRLIHSPAR